MGFFQNLKKAVGLEKEAELPEATTVDNLRQGGTINFPMMFEPAPIAEIVSAHNQAFQITKQGNFDFPTSLAFRTWAELDYGELYLARRGSKVELIKPISNLDDFLDHVDVDSFRELLHLEEHETKVNANNVEEVESDDKLIKITSEFSTLKEEEFLVQNDVIEASCTLYDNKLRFIEAKNLNSTAYLYILILESGETLVFESTLVPIHELDFV